MATLTRLGRTWAWILTFGIISLVAGLVVIFWPRATLLIIAAAFAVQLILAGVFRFVMSFALTTESIWRRVRLALLAGLSFIIGIFLLAHLVLSVLIMAIVLGVYWMVHGVIELFEAIGHSNPPGRAWAMASGIMSIVAGIVVIVFPRISLLVLTLVLGVWLVIFGVLLIVRAFRTRRAAHMARPGTLLPSGE